MNGAQLPFDQYVVWFLTGSIDLYGDDALRKVASQAQDIVDALNRSSDVVIRVEARPVMKETDQIRATVLAANADPSVVGVIAWMHTFSPSKMWISALASLQKPLLHLATQHNEAMPWANINFDFLNLNQSAHGDREFAHGLSRSGAPSRTIVGHVNDPSVLARVGTWQRAAMAKQAAYGIRVARFGDNMRYVAVTEGDKVEATRVFGAQINTWGVTELAALTDSADPADVDRVLQEYDDSYIMVPELRADGAHRESLRYAAQIEVALRQFLEAGGFSAFCTNFEDLGPMRQLPGLAVQRLQAEGYGFGPEGDWKTALLVRLAAIMGTGLPGGASIMEDYTYDLTPGAQLILGSHMLEVSSCLTTTKPELQLRPLSIGNREDPPRLVFHADPGPGVVASLTDSRDRFRFTANAIEIVEPSQPLPDIGVAHAIWKPKPDFETSVACWLAAGACHHTCLTTQIGIDAFRALAEMLRIEFLAIDDETTASRFADAVRWNEAYFRLVRGF